MSLFTRSTFKQNPIRLLRKAVTRGVYTLRTGYWHTGERSCPDFPDEIFLNHLKVYRFAAQFCRGKRILDVGCGTGYGTAYLAESAISAAGVDFSRQAVRFAQKRYGSSKAHFLRMSAESLAFADQSFDFVISIENFEHLQDHRANLRDISRVLTDQGMLLLATPNPEMFVGVSNRYHTHEFPYEELQQISQEFFAESVISENLLTPPSELGQRAQEDRRKKGAFGIRLATNPMLWEQQIDVSSLANSHSFFCFARKPRRKERTHPVSLESALESKGSL
jgi:2-polyprenyl-3-methyl-5-hydroxy-6-metoxy-1,4-benzoquinol methylase